MSKSKSNKQQLTKGSKKMSTKIPLGKTEPIPIFGVWYYNSMGIQRKENEAVPLEGWEYKANYPSKPNQTIPTPEQKELAESINADIILIGTGERFNMFELVESEAG